MSFLEIENLSVRLKGSQTRLLRDVSLQVDAGEVMGLVGESGAGKSMIGKAILGILPLSAEIAGGKIMLEGTDLLTLPPKARRALIGAKAALIPQDPLTALNPSKRIGPQITNRLVDILGWSRSQAEARALAILAEVQIQDPERVLRAYPHELSGGMRQRILIASAFAAEPRLIIADEPTTALDVTVQKQILRLIRDLQTRHNTALLFVTHDLGVVAKICQRMTVLFSGHVLEATDVRTFFQAPAHPYSQALLAATPRHDAPETSLNPVPEAIIAALHTQIADIDRSWSDGK